MPTNQALANVREDSLSTNADIERICQERSEQEKPPQAFIISGVLIRNSLLAMRRDFLDEGQGLGWPRRQLLGATFDPDWGFAFAELNVRTDADTEFAAPSCRFEDSAIGDTWGYRLCPMEDREIPEVIGQVAQIRRELSKPRETVRNGKPFEILITDV
jgi:hypothetical protein